MNLLTYIAFFSLKRSTQSMDFNYDRILSRVIKCQKKIKDKRGGIFIKVIYIGSLISRQELA